MRHSPAVHAGVDNEMSDVDIPWSEFVGEEMFFGKDRLRDVEEMIVQSQ